MTTPQLPRIGQTLTQNDKSTPEFYKWFEVVNRALTAGGLSTDQAAAAIAVIATKLGSPDGTVEGIPDQSRNAYALFGIAGVSVSGDGTAENPWFASLNATTDQVPEGATNLYFTDARAVAAVGAISSVFNRIDGNGDIRIDGNGDLRISS